MLLHTKPGAMVWPAAMIVWGPGFKSATHRHHCVQLVMRMRGTLRIRKGPEEDWTTCGAALVRPDVRHEVEARNGTVLIAFVEAESELGAALCDGIEHDIESIPRAQLVRWRSLLGGRPSREVVERWVRRELLRRRRIVKIHPRVHRVLNYIREKVGVVDDFSLATLARVAGLSESRFMHVFTESVGVPVRPYVRWVRLQRAACELMAGRTATAAAHTAGFSDAAHLTRTFRRMLGATPTELALRKKVSRGVSLDSV